MTDKKLVAYVTLESPPPSCAVVSFGPKDFPLPDWAMENLKDSPHLFEDSAKHRKDAVVEVVEAEPKAKELSTETEAEDVVSEAEKAHKGHAPSRNKSAATWEAYLRENGVAFPEAASRDTLIELAEREGLV